MHYRCKCWPVIIYPFLLLSFSLGHHALYSSIPSCHSLSQWPSLTQRACLSSWGCSGSGVRCRSRATMRVLSTRQDLDFQLSRVQISSILRANEQVALIIIITTESYKAGVFISHLYVGHFRMHTFVPPQQYCTCFNQSSMPLGSSGESGVMALGWAFPGPKTLDINHQAGECLSNEGC